MALFLYKPHVEGPDGNITSPDIIVDHTSVDGSPVAVNRLTHQCWQQTSANDTARAAYGIMALGGGALILPTLVLESGSIVVARMAWRLNNLDSHIGEVQLNDVALSNIGLPANEIESAGGHGDTLPRGIMLIKTYGEDTRNANLIDPRLDRKLLHRVVFERIDEDRWGDSRPQPRYSVGPMKKEVQHFI